jgi:O-acetyl-ADP-ribose deacetylase (regulator of RNase III)
MIESRCGDIVNEDTEALVNTVNCVGVMGKGVALQFKVAFPANFREYAAACRRGEVVPGKVFVHETGQLTNPRFIMNFPTKRHWRDKSRIEDIEAGLRSLRQEVEARNIRSVALPPLGCGLGGLNWAEVRPRIERQLSQLQGVRVVVFEPEVDDVDSVDEMNTVDIVDRERAGAEGGADE